MYRRVEKSKQQWRETLVTGKVIAFANQKGGVGKTTSCVNIAASMVAAKRDVLMIDLDPQGNATMGAGIDKLSLEYTIGDVLTGEAEVTSALIPASPGGFSVLPSNASVTKAEIILLQKEEKEQQLTIALADLKENYDFILIDCPPSLNMLTLNALVAADSVLIPMQCEYYALEGLSMLLNTIREIQEKLNPSLNVEGIVRTMYDGRNRLALEVSEQLITHFNKKVYKTVIPRNVRLAEAPSHGLPILLYDKNSTGAAAYLSLTGEILRQQVAPAQNPPVKKEESKQEEKSLLETELA